MCWTVCIAYCSSSCSLHLKSAKATAGLHESIWEQDQSSLLRSGPCEEVLNVSDAMGKYWRVLRSSWKAWWFQQECEYSGDIPGLMVLKLQLTPMNLTWEKGDPMQEARWETRFRKGWKWSRMQVSCSLSPNQRQPNTERLLHLIFLPILSSDVTEQEFFHLLPQSITKTYFDLRMGCNFN